MRKTLSILKNRGKTEDGLARIYSISYADSDTEDLDKKKLSQVGLTYSSAIAFAQGVHSALSFGIDGAFRLNNYFQDIIGIGRKTRNSNRPV